jgi:hypothetical protein
LTEKRAERADFLKNMAAAVSNQPEAMPLTFPAAFSLLPEPIPSKMP